MTREMSFDSLPELLAKLRRREFLKAAGVGVATSTVGVGRAAAQPGSVAEGPEKVGPFPAEVVDPKDLPPPDIPEDPDIIGEGSGEGEEFPRERPDSNRTASGRTPELQTGTTGSGLSVTTEFDGFTTRDVVRGVDFDDDGTVDDDEKFFGIPSDNQIATGETHHVTVINSEIGFIEKGTPADGADRKGGDPPNDDYLTHFRLEDFFEPVLSLHPDDEGDPTAFQFENIIVFDPRARFDPDAGRFYVLCVEFNLPDEVNADDDGEFEPINDPNDFTGAFLLAVSSTENPSDPWTVYRIPPADNTGLIDYPTLGYDGEAVYLAQNFFDFTDDGEFIGFGGATLTVLDRNQLLAADETGDGVSGWEFSKLRNPDGSLAFTLQPAAMAGETGLYHLANSRFLEGKTLTVWDVDVPSDFSAPGLDNGAVRVAPYANAPAAQQPDTPKKIDTLDTRLMNLAWDGSHLWTAHTTAEGYVRWYELDPGGPSLVQSGAYQRENWSTFLPTVESNGTSTVLVHNVAAEREFTGVEVAGRTAEFDAGKLEDNAVVQGGEVAYNYDDTTGAIGPGGEETVLRWGDYNGVAVDPEGGYWVIGQYAKDPTPDEEGPTESELYGTRIAYVTFSER